MKVSLLGDSIRLIGYGERVKQLLGPEVEVYQPTENCRFAKHTLRGLFDWAVGLRGSDVIHWNNGLWDVCKIFDDEKPFSTVSEYVETMVRIAEILFRFAPRVIFATTTPVLEGHRHNDNKLIKEYNEAVVPRLREMGVEINDLHALISSDTERYLRKDDMIHLSAEGIEAAAKQVIETIVSDGKAQISGTRVNKNAEKDAVLVLTDLEGICDVSTIDAIPAESALYPEACRNLVLDTNASVAALFDGGAKKVYVLDGHGSGQNFTPGLLDKRATQVTIADLSEVIKEVSCVVLVGMHAKSGTALAFLDHTQSSARIHRYYYNGKIIGELDQVGAFAGYFGVPCVTISGDEAVCREAESSFPGIATAQVKTAKSRNLAVCLPAEEARRKIYDATRDGYSRRAEFSPYPVKLPLNIDVEFNRADYCDEALEKHPQLRRLDAFTVRQTTDKIEGYLDVLILWG